ncbi:MAG: right-handed parallel beta-helix repeat-containing protein [Candidatus Latescibacteria bacterium]|nr:right-handed parallel beta-helix repeat-containing protein [Candidatus Latescibacterota bacterium]
MTTISWKISKHILLDVFITAQLTFISCSDVKTPGNIKSPQAVKEVMDGKRIKANAAWWGFDEVDATEALQLAINSGAKKVIVPNMGSEWIVCPIQLHSDLEIVFEKDTVVTAKKGEFKGRGDCLLRGSGISNLILSGYGATLRMQKDDYMSDEYEKAEWRMVIGLYSCNNVRIQGLTLKDSGGDGIYLGVTGDTLYCSNVHIKDVVCDNNYRQGISVISAENLLIEGCTLKNTWGTPPAAGIDLEPNHAGERMKNCLIRNCVFENNEGAGILAYLRPLSSQSEDISIRFEGCRVTSAKGSGIIVGAIKDDGPMGIIEFDNCTVDNTAKVGLQIYDKSADRARVRFTNCSWKNTALTVEDNEPPSPLWIYLRRPELTKRQGGVDIVNCIVEDSINRPFLTASEKESSNGVYDITGSIKVLNPKGTTMNLGEKSEGIKLEIE